MFIMLLFYKTDGLMQMCRANCKTAYATNASLYFYAIFGLGGAFLPAYGGAKGLRAVACDQGLSRPFLAFCNYLKQIMCLVTSYNFQDELFSADCP